MIRFLFRLGQSSWVVGIFEIHCRFYEHEAQLWERVTQVSVLDGRFFLQNTQMKK